MIRKISFARGSWDESEWMPVKSTRWEYVHGFRQCEDRDRFYDFTIETGLPAHDNAADDEH